MKFKQPEVYFKMRLVVVVVGVLMCACMLYPILHLRTFSVPAYQ